MIAVSHYEFRINTEYYLCSVKVNQTNYSLIDSGKGQKLEQFGPYALIRPEASAQWSPALPAATWEKLAHARFVPNKKEQSGINRGGIWEKLKPLPDEWKVQFEVERKSFQFRVAPSPFGHVALFPEQFANWQFLAQQLKKVKTAPPRLLNLFAYTGAASVVARAFGADVVHVDSSRPILNQARQNMELNALSDIRWVYEDAFKFARREASRGRKYHGIILDPPPEGRGPKGERWVLNNQLDELLGHCAAILEPRNSFLMMSLYAGNWIPKQAEADIRPFFERHKISSTACFLNPDKGSHQLTQGITIRAVV